jgi:hypothetical protein
VYNRFDYIDTSGISQFGEQARTSHIPFEEYANSPYPGIEMQTSGFNAGVKTLDNRYQVYKNGKLTPNNPLRLQAFQVTFSDRIIKDIAPKFKNVANLDIRGNWLSRPIKKSSHRFWYMNNHSSPLVTRDKTALKKWIQKPTGCDSCITEKAIQLFSPYSAQDSRFEAAPALAIFVFPNSEVNKKATLVWNKGTRKVLSREDRRVGLAGLSVDIGTRKHKLVNGYSVNLNHYLRSFLFYHSHLNPPTQFTFESIRTEVFYLFGRPNDIKRAIKRIESLY